MHACMYYNVTDQSTGYACRHIQSWDSTEDAFIFSGVSFTLLSNVTVSFRFEEPGTFDISYSISGLGTGNVPAIDSSTVVLVDISTQTGSAQGKEIFSLGLGLGVGLGLATVL